MTENKRFKLGYVCGDFGLIDNDEWIDLHSMSENSEKNVQICINKMNELHDKYIDEYALRETLQLDLQRVEEENKELKAQLYCDDDNVCNICKHQQLMPHKVMQGYYTAKCEKGHKECSKEDLRHCDDFKLKELSE